MDIKVKKLLYENDLGSTILKNVTVDLEQDQVLLMKKGTPIEELDYGLNGADIEKAEQEIAQEFFTARYQDVLTGTYELSADEIRAVQDFLGLNVLQFSKVLGLDRGSLTNIYKRNSCSHPVQILILERMGMELARKGAAKAMYSSMSKSDKKDRASEADPGTVTKINKVRYGGGAA